MIYPFIEKVQTKLERITKNTSLQFHDWLLSSYSSKILIEKNLHLIIASQSDNVQFTNSDWLLEVTNHFLSHRFDLLGSGWTKVGYGMKCRGLEEFQYKTDQPPSPDTQGDWLRGLINRSNFAESKRIWNLIGQQYEPIDWHLDFKSGYRWNNKAWHTKISFAHEAGVDIKVPWELSRMQHLPLLAKAYSFAQKPTHGFPNPENYPREFRNQILDFIATNPPRWGVNWSSTMDVSIRIINWLLAYDLFSSFGAKFDKSFNEVFYRSIYEHGLHIANHLEWHPKYRNNHYLSNIVGLIFVSSYLPSTSKINSWFIFSVRELINEVKFQFHEEGSNFEASTCYHRLSSELVLYATTIVLGLPPEKQHVLKEFSNPNSRLDTKGKTPRQTFYPLPNSKGESPFPAWYFKRLEKMAEFTLCITKPDGHVPQIGDNDSGRLTKLFPIYQKMTVKSAKEKYQNLNTYSDLHDQDTYWVENFLDHRSLVSAFWGLFNKPDSSNFAGDDQEGRFIRHLSHGIIIHQTNSSTEKIYPGLCGKNSDEAWRNCEILLSSLSASKNVTYYKFASPLIDDKLDYCSYPDFGLFICKSDGFYLAIRCGSIGQNGNGGHAHNDQLSIELTLDGNNIISDPGTYLYSPLINKRNIYRSTYSHFAPHILSMEPATLTRNIFSLGDPRAEVLYFGKQGFVGCHEGYGFKVYRQIVITNFDIIISDYSEKSELTKDSTSNVPFSPAYGVVQSD
jgi:hypothetical protein